MNLVNWGRTWGVFVFALAAVLILSASVAYGQGSGAGTITGRALDPRGASVPDAKVTVMNVETGISRTTTTTSDGLYRFENLPPGFYDVTIEAAAFTKAIAKGVKLQTGEARDVNFNLELAGQKESVVVTSEIPLIEATKTDVSAVVTDRDVAVLPATTGFGSGGVSNDYEGLALIAPGVRYDLTTDSSDLIGPGAINDRGLLINIDGGNIIDQVVSVRDSLGASLEEVKEFQVLTNNYNAEYGQAGGVILNVITKSGTNSFHGDFHAYFRGRNMGTSPWFYNAGGASGCPASDFDATGTQTSIAGCGRPPFFKHEYGITAGGPIWKDHTFLFGTWERVHQGVPLVLTPPTGTVTASQPTNEVLWSAKLDHKLTNNHQFTVRFNAQRDLSDNILVQVPQNSSPLSLVASVIHDHTLNIGLVSTPTSHTVNEARFFWHHFLSQTPDKTTIPGQSGPGFYFGAAFCCPQSSLQNRYQYIDNLSWTHGSHTVKTGVNISRFPFFSLFKQFAFGEYTYANPFTTGAPGSAANPATLFTTSFGPGSVGTVDNVYGAYVQDSWQVKRNVTVNYGIRYDLESGAFRGGSTPVPGHLAQCFQNNGIIKACSSDHNNWQPRLGVAWSPNYDHGFMHTLFGAPGKSVVRASFAEVTELAYLNIVLDSLNFDGTTLLTAGITDPAVLAFGSTTPVTAPPQSLLNNFNPFPPKSFGRIRPIAANLRNAETRHANLSISRQLSNSMVAEVGYIGVFGFGLYGETDTNYPIIKADPAHPGFSYFANGSATGDPTLPANGRPDNRFDGVRTNRNSRTSAYHGGYARFTQRAAHHVQFQGSYTFSKTLSSVEDFFGTSDAADPTNLRAERAVSQQDIRHMGQFGVVFDTEKLVSTRFVRTIVNDWSFGVLGTLQSGRPWPLSTGSRPFATVSFPAIGNEVPQRPNVEADGTLNVNNIAGATAGTLLLGPGAQALCPGCLPAAFTFAAPADRSKNGARDSIACTDAANAVGSCAAKDALGNSLFPNHMIVDFRTITGNLQRDAGLTNHYTRFDMSIIKAFKVPVREGMQLELKLDVFNVFNHPQFTQFNGNDTLNALKIPSNKNLTNPVSLFAGCTSCLNPITGHYVGSGGQVLTVQDLQKGRVDPNVNSPIFGGIGDPAATDVARILQLGIRFRW